MPPAPREDGGGGHQVGTQSKGMLTGVRPWRIRLAMRRSRIQWALLSVVLAVSVLSATLLATLYLLSVATETFAARAALTNVNPADVRVVQRIVPQNGTGDVLPGSRQAAAEFFGAVPYATHISVQGGLLAVPRAGRPIALAYLGSSDDLQQLVVLRSGRWPQPSAGGAVQVIVPPAFLHDLGAAVGDTVSLAPVFSRSDLTAVTVVGTYAVKRPGGDDWRFDRFAGSSTNPTTIVPFSGGLVTTDGYGPLYTAPADVNTFPVDTVIATYVPDFTGTSTAQLRELLSRFDGLGRTTTATIGAAASNVTLSSTLDATIGGVVGSLAVTRSSVLVTGLLLLVLAVAALGQTARLMAERRHAEQHLMIARGGSGRQIFRLGLIEATVLAVATAAVSAPLARLAYLWLASVPVMANAGMHRDPGVPPWTWAVTGAVGLTLLIVLVAPLVRRAGTFVDAEQSRARPGRRAAFQRSGIDVAVLALAALAYGQLRAYKSPLLASGAVASVDPLLAAGPALALLAGALVAVRLIPAASRVLEAVAARGRRAVMPLAAWEVGRRAARAVSAILLLTLAVSIGTFAMAFLTSWHHSQDDQARYLHPPDAIVSGVDGPWLAQPAVVNDATLGATGSPTVALTAQVSTVDATSRRRGQQEFSGSDIQLVATDNAGLRVFGVGRLTEAGGARVPGTLVHDAPVETQPVEIPGRPDALQFTVSADASATALAGIKVRVTAVLRDALGDYQTLDLGSLPADGSTQTLTATLADTESLARYAWPLSLVGMQATWQASATDTRFQEQPLTLTLSYRDIRAVVPRLTVPVAGVPPVVDATPVTIPARLSWTVSPNGVSVSSLTPSGDQLHVEAITSANILRARSVTLALTAAPQVGAIPLVATGSALDALGLKVGDQVRFQVDRTVLQGYIAQRVPVLAGATLRSQAVIANISDLELGLIQAGAAVTPPNQWWIAIPDTAVPSYAAGLPAGTAVTSRAGLAIDLKQDPLRIAIQAALWLVTGAAVILAAVGFAVHAVVTVRAREIEFAQLRAVGILRSQLLRVVTAESVLLSVLGVVFGVGLGIALAYLVAPLVSVGADGRPPIPAVLVAIPWATVGLLALEVAGVLVLTVLLVAQLLRRINPAQMLRLGDER